jgi:hypothetical protein
MGGVFNTGTHGSIFTCGPLADMILSIDLVLFVRGLAMMFGVIEAS